ncbi:hydroxymethylbilane synthase [Elongatibacter sediminis]|uniref:Porphobilinogen deaminase n=1 Tax=Elongatibacter sediminis TaxID=3119006 RepID=A0AAW9RC98_9GAMM
MTDSARLVIATRRSELALWQANHVAALLRELHDGLEVELLPLVTQGDRVLDRPLAQIGGKGLFLKELETALLDGRADLAVHSMKDVPVVETEGLPVDTVLQRANPFDGLLGRTADRLAGLASGARVGTSSLRRQCQLRALRPDLEIADLRGNINTRIGRLDAGDYDAIVLACAGLERLGLQQRVTEVLAAPDWLPAPTQGTIGVQRRADDGSAARLLAPLQHPETAAVTRVERTIARRLEGSCQVPLAVFARFEGDHLAVDALVGSPDGRRVLRCTASGAPSDADRVASEVAGDLLDQGAREIISALSESAAH